MTNQKQLIRNESYEAILAYENKTAQTITAKVLEKPELSAWMILMPIVFILFMQRSQKYKAASTAFCEGYLYTKKIALDTACRIYKNEYSHEESIAMAAETVQKNPKAEQTVINIYNQQIEEIKLLCEHYLALLASKEDKYDQMVVSHYQTEDNYLCYINRLTKTEKEVTRATTSTFKDAVEVPEILGKMEKYLWELRVEEAKQFFIQR
ncbi:NF038143 family protein [Desulfosporosinus sp. BICA1-9]|uniref:NF038143 family protein n=1 Tax=Desulfosporosinus sp. BICA1-9 TaxID=1531958 RepID=UPI00054B9C78|nr:NF038143 family protein [Desulfosporosinus sp. BICA1-9]KJS47372.1 MAG: hypothetical protein VR66_19990 [Peptococcaceae bacterium BRH_c23]KJS88514.1 MAG: hypothetical protein JL57_11870 [Desulfosporosinus sp. BICA1-9]HBW35162.1 hypothetical protein [Desulfosporosinus sp.]